MANSIKETLHLLWKKYQQSGKVALLASVLVFFSFWLQGNIGINLADEGSLWYGTECTALGDFPVRDFESYDPGRYYWTAAWSFLLGSGIMKMRISVAVFQTIGLTFGLLTLRRMIKSWMILGGAGLLLLLWMYPRHKLFEHSLTMAAVYFAVLVLEKPSLLRDFIAGVFVGIAGFFGRNHGFYNFVSFFLLIVMIWYKVERTKLFRRLTLWALGILIGYSPMLVMFLFIRGFFESFLYNKILFIFHHGSTNITLPVPWPWTINYSTLSSLEIARFSTGIFFILIPLFYIMASLRLFLDKQERLIKHAPFVASILVGAVYLFHAFSRADLGHLAQVIHPLLLGLLSLPYTCQSAYKKVCWYGLLAAVCILSVLSVGISAPYYKKFSTPEGTFVQIDIRGDKLWVHRYHANIINSIKTIHTQKIGNHEELFIAPNLQGLYRILERKAPLWDIYPIWKETEQRQRQMVTELNAKSVNWVVLGDVALDGRDDLRFRNTHHFLWTYFMENFSPILVKELPNNYQVLRRKHRI